MQIIINDNVALSNLGNFHVSCHYLFKSSVACHEDLERDVSPCRV